MSVIMSTKGKAMLNITTGPDIFTVSHFERVGETSKYFMFRYIYISIYVSHAESQGYN